MLFARTVLGDVAPADLGPTLSHEHLIGGWTGFAWDPVGPTRAQMVDEAVRQLVELRQSTGVVSVVDATPPDLGRDLRSMAEVSRRAGVHVIAATGLYRHTVEYPRYWRLADEDRVAGFLLDEIQVGTRNDGIRCGVIKVATVEVELNDLEGKLLRAAARAAVATGCAVITHTEAEAWRPGNPGLAQVHALAAAGLDPARVIVGHACSSSSLDDLMAVLRTGASLGFDRVGAPRFQSDEARADMFARVVAAGYGGQLLLSHDHQAVWRISRAGAPATAGSFELLHRTFLPMLRERGVGTADIDAALIGNPARVFALQGARSAVK